MHTHTTTITANVDFAKLLKHSIIIIIIVVADLDRMLDKELCIFTHITTEGL